jgi:hypothetical protein
MEDFRRYYKLEQYLLDVVGPRFRKQGTLSTEDFICIIIWKANRAKTKILELLRKKGGTKNLDAIIQKFTAELWSKQSSKEKLQYLMEEWGFRLPIATAILTILEPEKFTVYDQRVRGIVDYHPDLQVRKWSDSLWSAYENYVAAVQESTPEGLSLRDKDRYLWGKSFYESLMRMLESGFTTKEQNKLARLEKTSRT